MLYNVIPTPKKAELIRGDLILPLAVRCEADEWCECRDILKHAFSKLFHVELTDGDGGLVIRRDSSLAVGSYRIDVDDVAVLSASDKDGILYAIATLIQAAEVKDGKIVLERAHVEDKADKEYRSLMVDLAREWHPAYTVLQYIDLCFMLKIKHLHLHFLDNERYTLPSRAFPKLNEEASYTYDEIAKMREHARALGIVIIPEFEAPGHAAMLSRCYPEVFSNEPEREAGEETTECGAIITDDSIICAGKESSFEGVKTLLSEMLDLFPDSPYIHIGGDEAKIAAWGYCPHCKAYMKEHGIEDVHELYSEYVGRVAREVIAHGRVPIVWEGFPKKGVNYIPKETVVVAWESLYHMSYDLIAEGFKVINASWVPMYVVPNPEPRFNWGIPEILKWNVYNWQHWYEHSKAYKSPINVTPTEQVIGATLCLWECTFEEEITKCINNLTAMSERVWNVDKIWTVQEFCNRARHTVHRLARFIQTV